MRYTRWPDRARWEDYVSALGLRHHSPRELVARCDARGNGYPPVELWGNVALSAHWWDRVRDRLGRPSILTSTYRTPSYNRRIGGAGRSVHMAFAALDGGIKGVSPGEVAEVAREIRGQHVELPGECVRILDLEGGPEVAMYSLPRWTSRDRPTCLYQIRGGVGTYPGFVHLDARGLDLSWGDRP